MTNGKSLAHIGLMKTISNKGDTMGRAVVNFAKMDTLNTITVSVELYNLMITAIKEAKVALEGKDEEAKKKWLLNNFPEDDKTNPE